MVSSSRLAAGSLLAGLISGVIVGFLVHGSGAEPLMSFVLSAAIAASVTTFLQYRFLVRPTTRLITNLTSSIKGDRHNIQPTANWLAGATQDINNYLASARQVH